MSSDLLDLALSAARAAGALLLEHFREPARGVGTKSTPTDLVSEADRASEELVLGRIRDGRPDDGILAEEGGRADSASGLVWVVDPLDGTVNYLYGFPAWCVSVAAEDDEGVLVGVVRDPLRRETFLAVRSGGAWLGEEPLRVNDPVELEQALVATGFSYQREHRRSQARVVGDVAVEARDIRRMGSAALDLCSLAAGRVDGYYEDSVSKWDWAAGALIAAEAGAVVETLPGPDGREGVLAAGPGLFDALKGVVSPAG